MRRTKHPTGRIRSRARRAVPIVTLGAAVAAGAAIAFPRLGPDDDAPTVAAVLDVATATEAELSGTATVTGIVENAATIEVLHRIDGVTASANPTANDSTPTAAAPAVPAAFANADTTESTASGFASGRAIAPTDPTSTTSTTTTTTTEPPPPTTETPAPTTPTTATVPATPDSTDPTATEPSVSSLPSLPAPTTITTTVEGDLDSPTDPEGRPTGGGGGGDGVGGTGGTLGAAASAATAGDTAIVTERVTSLPALGETIDNGDVLYSVDGSPVVALVGELPAWRTLSTDSDDGADILQLEESLVALGYGDGLTVDAAFDSATAAAVEAWQDGIGVEPTGTVPIGSVVFVPTNMTVTSVDASVGDDVTAGDLVASVSAATQSVVIDVAADHVSDFAVGQAVTIETGNGGEPIAGVVTNRRSVTSEDGTTGVQATITPKSAMGVTDGVSVDVVVPIDGAVDTSAAVLIPAEALVSRLDGAYAVEVRNADGSTEWVPVDVVQFNESTVAVSGSGLTAGIDVLVPA